MLTFNIIRIKQKCKRTLIRTHIIFFDDTNETARQTERRTEKENKR